MRDETDLGGLKLTIDLKRGVDPEKLMQKLYRLTPLQDSFPCNFNILIAGMPRVMGVGEILEEWTAWRVDCVKRRLFFQIQKKEDRLHLLKGLERILLDIDKAIRVIRETEVDSEVIPNLMIEFGIDEVQANFVAEIKLRNINKEYILKQTKAISELEKEIADLRDTLGSHRKLLNVIKQELKAGKHTVVLSLTSDFDDSKIKSLYIQDFFYEKTGDIPAATTAATTKAPATKPASPATFDAGIILAVVTAAAGAGVVVSKKRK
jgi:DNA gyrase subunit A